MKQVLEFIRRCGVFFVLTTDSNAPAGRPFGAIMEHEGKLYISTGDGKAVYRQLKENPQMQLLALKGGTREWIRVSGRAQECTDAAIKTRMLQECPALKKHFPTADAPHFAVFAVDVQNVEKY